MFLSKQKVLVLFFLQFFFWVCLYCSRQFLLSAFSAGFERICAFTVFFLVNSSHTWLFARLHLLKRRRKGVGLLVLRACAERKQGGRNGKLN